MFQVSADRHVTHMKASSQAQHIGNQPIIMMTKHELNSIWTKVSMTGVLTSTKT